MTGVLADPQRSLPSLEGWLTRRKKKEDRWEVAGIREEARRFFWRESGES